MWIEGEHGHRQAGFESGIQNAAMAQMNPIEGADGDCARATGQIYRIANDFHTGNTVSSFTVPLLPRPTAINLPARHNQDNPSSLRCRRLPALTKAASSSLSSKAGRKGSASAAG